VDEIEFQIMGSRKHRASGANSRWCLRNNLKSDAASRRL
jgi:hypothetical protein